MSVAVRSTSGAAAAGPHQGQKSTLTGPSRRQRSPGPHPIVGLVTVEMCLLHAPHRPTSQGLCRERFFFPQLGHVLIMCLFGLQCSALPDPDCAPSIPPPSAAPGAYLAPNGRWARTMTKPLPLCDILLIALSRGARLAVCRAEPGPAAPMNEPGKRREWRAARQIPFVGAFPAAPTRTDLRCGDHRGGPGEPAVDTTIRGRLAGRTFTWGVSNHRVFPTIPRDGWT